VRFLKLFLVNLPYFIENIWSWRTWAEKNNLNRFFFRRRYIRLLVAARTHRFGEGCLSLPLESASFAFYLSFRHPNQISIRSLIHSFGYALHSLFSSTYLLTVVTYRINATSWCARPPKEVSGGTLVRIMKNSGHDFRCHRLIIARF